MQVRAAVPSATSLLGEVALLLAPHGRLLRVLKLTFAGGKIASAEVIGDRARLEQMELALVE